ncbi:hypothetical protein WJ32_02815 [Burkholderia ubonensis]|uniref:Uncharacterized protein n=1 Tax=Burkholderia ubonensis TaxID=101571 RepID=A0A118HI89_9BURK|nr:hypothetical protein WJ32_02815 [Burkholderia ubonensis]KVG51138.1 hypothetical protein WJ33_11295 [Burkholderia ubonensis]
MGRPIEETLLHPSPAQRVSETNLVQLEFRTRSRCARYEHDATRAAVCLLPANWYRRRRFGIAELPATPAFGKRARPCHSKSLVDDHVAIVEDSHANRPRRYRNAMRRMCRRTNQDIAFGLEGCEVAFPFHAAFACFAFVLVSHRQRDGTVTIQQHTTMRIASRIT